MNIPFTIKIKHTLFIALVCLFECLGVAAQTNITRVEYYVDNDPGIGAATALPIAAAADIPNLTVPINPAVLTEGIHRLYIRAKDANGNWSLTNSWLFYKPYAPVTTGVPALANITLLEYYIDNDPGRGNAASLSIAAATDIANAIIPVNPDTLTAGVHRLYVRARDAGSNWSLTNSLLFYKPYPPANSLPALSNINLLEYYVDTDPGFGSATPINISPATDLANLIIPINPERITPCQHRLFVRVRDANGKWSLVNSYSFTNEYFNETSTAQDFMVQLDGVNDYIDLGTWFNAPQFTVSFWVNPDSIQVQGAAIAALQNDLYLYDNPTAGVQNNYILSHLLQFDFLPNKWNHITITADSSTQTRKVYLFGQLIDSNQWAYNPTSGFNLKFGSGGFFPSNCFKGQFDEIKLWDNVLTQDEIYASLHKKFTGNEAGLLGYWNFNNGCSVVAEDLTPNNRNGSLMNGVGKEFSTVPNIGQQIIPNKAGNTNIVTVKVYDNLFQQGATAKLTRDGFTDILAEKTNINNDGSIVTITFNLSGKDTGLYNLIVSNPDTTAKTYTNSFTIEKGIATDLWVDIIGRNVMRNGRPFTFLVAYGNKGNVDAKGVSFWIVIKGDTSIQFKQRFEVTRPAGYENLLNYDEFPIYYNTDSLWGNPILAKVMPLYLPIVAAGSVNYLSFTITSSSPISTIEILAIIDKPFYPDSSSPSTLGGRQTLNDVGANHPPSCMIECQKAFIDAVVSLVLNLIPFVNCGAAVLEAAETFSNYNQGSATTTSLVWHFMAAIAQCFEVLGIAVPGFQIFQIASFSLDIAKAIRAKEICDKTEQECSSPPSGDPGGGGSSGGGTGGVGSSGGGTGGVGSPGSGSGSGSGSLPPPSGDPGGGGNPFGGASSASGSATGVGSYDPNEKIGPSKYQQTKSSFNYSILFENKETATAPAQEVTIIDTLDKAVFDISTFNFGPFGFGDTLHNSVHQYQKSFSQNIDLRPAKNMIVKVEGRVDTTAGIAYWRFISLNPATMLLTEDPTDGFLPPADSISNRGDGWVSYNINPYPWLESGTLLQNRATIIFDNNAPITTKNHENLIDKVPPVSYVKYLRPTQTDSNFVVQWTGRDSIISGIKNWNIYVSDNLLAYRLWQTNTLDSFAIFPGHPGHEYRFISIATDSANNIEGYKDSAEAITFVSLSIIDSVCIGDNAKIAAGNTVSGNTYRWQVNTGAGYLDVINGAIYSNATRDTLLLRTPPSSYTSNRYRCIITNGTTTDTTKEHELYFTNIWTGAVSTAWENAANWECNVLPDINTEVIIPKNVVNYPLVRSNAVCKSVRVEKGASVDVQTGFKITISGNRIYQQQ